MIRVVILAPVLGRPHRAAPLVESLAASVTGPIFEASVFFLCSPGDDDQIAACDALPAHAFTVGWEPGPGDYARKINEGVELSRDADFVLLGADDLRFHPGWLEAAMVAQLNTGACVVGTNDLGNRSVMAGRHATHPLVHVAYADCGVIDEPGKRALLHEGYSHNFCDSEFVGTAKARGTFVHAPDSHVEHLHPLWGKSKRDATYAKGDKEFYADRLVYEARRALWEHP